MREVLSIIFFVISFTCFVTNAAAQSPFFDVNGQESQSVLLQGQPYIKVWRDKARPDKAISAFGAINIQALPHTIWAIMTDCGQTRTIVPQMTVCKVQETSEDGSWDIRKQKIKIGPLLPKSVSIFRSDYVKHKSIQISLVGGNMKVQSGMWRLIPIDTNTTRVTYRTDLKPKFPVPNAILKKGVRTDVPKILLNLKATAEKNALTAKAPIQKDL